MNPEPPNLEAELRELQAAPLDDELLTRLEAAAAGNLTEPTREEIRLEALLRESTPARLDPAFFAELEAVFRDVPFPVNDKIVLFPKANASPRPSAKRPMWSAAAAVALIGAATALLMPPGEPVARTTSTSPRPAGITPNAGADSFVPAGFNRGVSKVKDEGVVWKSNTQPHSLMRVDYIDRITLKDEKGRTFQVEQPRVRYIMVPEKTD